jgi:hypothetical protein
MDHQLVYYGIRAQKNSLEIDGHVDLSLIVTVSLSLLALFKEANQLLRRICFRNIWRNIDGHVDLSLIVTARLNLAMYKEANQLLRRISFKNIRRTTMVYL